ncbi:hypothetical protein [Gandjariella thermophila]|uniref:Lipoprotein n=1 Tax=Gandjariella thermophila TaxID=1931992 RepID=A0A4D4IZC1_9PSEU|nr:hypothetical protein [Gandjariella thermophila]GDY28454.1 hypothetical protein GTS_00870 [Gandjariella thermophila]
MRVRRALRGIVLLAAAALGAAVPSASAASPATSTAPAAAGTVLVNCEHRAEVRPANFLLACADGTLRLDGMRWTQWGPRAAVGTGQQVVNDCDPYCAAGHYHSYPVRVTLDTPRPWPGHPGLTHYTQLNVVYLAGRPAIDVSHTDLWD